MRNSQTKAGSVYSASYSNGGDETQHGGVAQGAGSANAGAGMIPFNPTLALQTLLSGDMVTPKQRARAAQQLAQYFKELPAAPGLYAAYEPYLQLVVDVMLMTGKGARDLQACALEMLGALSGHNPRRFSDWMTQLIHRGYDGWLVEWSARLLIEGESRLPRAESGRSDYSDGAPETLYGWNEKTMEFLEFDAAFGRVIQLWRTILDHADDEQVVQCIVENLSRLLSRKEETSAAPSQWHTMIIGKLQVHFVDIADVLIGWATSTRSLSGLRERIVTLLQQLAPLWADNSVFSLQLMTSFAEEIKLRAGSFEENNKDIDSRVSILLVCFLLIARNVPELALVHGNSDSSPLERVLRSVKLTCIRDGNSTFCAMKCSEFLASLSAISPDSFSVLSIEAARFLCRQVAQLAIYRGESLVASTQMMTSICSIVEGSAASLATRPSSTEDAIGILTDEIGEQDAKTGCIVKSTKVLDCLVRQFTHDTARMSKLLFHLQGIGGLRAMKEIALCSVQKVRLGMNSINRLHSCMYGSCFISALNQYSRRQEPVSSSDIACLGTIVKALAEILEDTATLQLASSQIRMIAKMAMVALRAVHQLDLGDRADDCLELSAMQLLSRSLTLLMDIDVMAKDELLTMDLFALVGEAWSQRQISGSNMLSSRRALLAVFSFYSQCSSENVRKRCLSILTKQTSLRHGVVGVDTLARIALGFVVQPSKTIQQAAVDQILSVVAADALTTTHLGAVIPDNQTANYLKYNFTAVDFERVVRLLGDPACDVSAWRSLCSAIHDGNEANGGIDASFGISTSELIGGVVRAAARWCVHNRLRTHFGGPAQTFSCIEQLLMSIVFRMPRGSDAKSSSPLVSRSSQTSKVTAQATMEQGIGDWIALEFVGALELCISHAYSTRGSDQDPESESSRTLQFYRSNKVVCDDWLNRIRPLLIELSARSGSSDLRRIHSYASVSSMSMRIQRILKASASRAAPSKLSQDLASATVALDSALFVLCSCCSDLKDVDAIAGFQRWGEVLSKEMSVRCAASSEMGEWPTANLFPWLEGARLEASMQYEDAVVFYEALLRPIVDCAQSPSADTGQGSVVEMLDNSLRYLQMSPSTLLGCVKQCTHCYIALQRWPQAKDLVTTFLGIEETLVGHDQSSPALQPFVDSMRVWRHELDSTLFFSEDVRLLTRGTDDLVNRLRVCALQPEPLSGNSVSKKVEQLFLDISCITHGKNGEAAIGGEGFRIGAGVFDSLDAHVHDSTQWGDYLLRVRDTVASTPHGSGLEPRYLAFAKVASLARQQRNFELCGRLLNEIEAARTSLQSASLTVASEKAALLISKGTEDEGVRLLADACAETLRLGSISLPNDTKNELVQALGLLGSSLQTSAVTLDGSALVDPLLQDQSFPAPDMDCFDDTDVADGDSLDFASGKCFYLATCIAQSSSMAWLQYGNWCYQVGKRKTAEIVALNGYAHLSPFEEAEINTALDDLDACGSSRDAIVRGFCHLFENRALISQCGENFQHLCHQHLQKADDNLTVAKLVKLHSAFAARVLRYHLLAADNYSTYLELLGESSGSPCTMQDTMMVTLRLLNLLTNFGTYEEIGASIERTIASGPVAPWIPLVPQLICRVGHPNPTVARLVYLLLKRIARSSPHLIAYPVVANSTDCSSESELGCDSSPGLRGVLQVLKQVSSELVDGVALLVAELRRVSVLWDEAWISTLLKLSTYVGRKTVAIEKESARVARNSSLAPEEMRQLAQRKCAAILTPVLQTLESLWGSTCGSAGSRGLLTPHERSFLRDYGGDIGQALANLRGQCDADATGGSAATPQRVQAMWEPFNVILKALLNSVGRRERIGLHDISPAMVSIPETFRQTSMPGVFTRAGDGPEAFMRIQAILPAVAVLKTKTKPKCLQFIGSDGARQRYLLKAKEDLRLDERIMQFLTAVNTMLSADKAAAVRELGAQHYSVIPISEDAGLIQMVPNVMPFFQIYTSHQDQVHGARGPQMSPPPASGSGGVAMPGLHQPQPPTVQFYAALKRHGISNVSHRSKWPLAVLRQVYAELANQMPRNTVKQELMLHSSDLKENWMKNSRLSRSMAVMSVLGYTIGLGDRHLDNILLHVDTGNVVHIDYNVCFDKGLKLKVPEVVPFRLTPMLQDALGLTGVDGVFRSAFETTLRVVRSDTARESLLSLLEAFVYSPLMEWKADDSRRAGRAGDNDSDEPEGMSSVASGPANSSGDVTAEGSASSLTSGQDVLEAPTGSRESPTALAQSRYGLEVLSRIEDKLSGIVHDGAGSSRVFTVEQQASWLIAEATKVDNLCAMYEGWTPWI